MRAPGPIIPELAAHVAELAMANGVAIKPHAHGRAWRKKRLVGLRPVRSVVAYAVALHELGHVIGGGHSAPRLEKEANAWLWAMNQALPGAVDKRFRETARKALNSYLRWAIGASYRKVPPRLPARSHPFWRLAKAEPPPAAYVLRSNSASRRLKSDSIASTRFSAVTSASE